MEFFQRGGKSKAAPNCKPGKENIEDVSKFRPISRLNYGGNILENVLINKINHRVYYTSFINNNQYGFTPQNITTDEAIAVKTS